MARHAEFDRDQVLESAMRAFWERGYCATSVADLTQRTQLKPGSLYAAFASKQGLFLAVLERYAAASLRRVNETLRRGHSPLHGIRLFFDELGERLPEATAGGSCLLVNTMVELARHDDLVQRQVAAHLGAIEQRFLQALQAARDCGELAAQHDIQALAAFLMSSIWGIRVLATSGANGERIRSVTAQVSGYLEQLSTGA
ncbi:MAG: TetR family transcriptional regulator [Thiohalocapsa sp.]